MGPDIQRILGASSADDCNEQKYELLNELQGGRPASELLPLFRAENGNAVEIGVWIASELGSHGKPLLPYILPLLGHPSRIVRFFTLDCVLMWASAADKWALASAVLLIEDRDAAVRWQALRFLSLASTEQLQAARSQMKSMGMPGHPPPTSHGYSAKTCRMRRRW